MSWNNGLSTLSLMVISKIWLLMKSSLKMESTIAAVCGKKNLPRNFGQLFDGAGRVFSIPDGYSGLGLFLICFWWFLMSHMFRIIDLINIHLFHDESNLELTQNPLLYSENRKRALDYTIESYSTWQYQISPEKPDNLFIFGDFNFRLRTDSFLRVCFFLAFPFFFLKLIHFCFNAFWIIIIYPISIIFRR